MSQSDLSKAVGTILDRAIVSFIDSVSSKYEIPESELRKLLAQSCKDLSSPSKSKKPLSKPVSSPSSEDLISEKGDSESGAESEVLTRSKLESGTVKDLKDILKRRGLKLSGKKNELIDRILGEEETSTSSSKKDVASVKPASLTKKTKPESKPRIVKREADDNYLHLPSYLIVKMRGKEWVVIGRELPERGFETVNAEIVEESLQYGLDYEVPENLSSGKDKVDEILEEEILSEEEELLSEEEELLSEEDEEEEVKVKKTVPPSSDKNEKDEEDEEDILEEALIESDGDLDELEELEDEDL